jgi:Flp pilus assembly protein TadG
MRRLDARGFRRSRLVSGVTVIYFALIALPALWFGAALSVDLTRVIIANHEIAVAAEAAALAGAYQFQPGEDYLNTAQAQAVATQTFCAAQAAGVTHLTVNATGVRGLNCTGLLSGAKATISVSVITAPEGPGPTEVSVTAQYKVPGLLFVRLFGASGTYVSPGITEYAAVCIPGQQNDPETGAFATGYCARPTD